MKKHKTALSQVASISVFFVAIGGLVTVIAMLVMGNDIRLLNPQGYIANEQRNLMIFSLSIMMIVALPTLFILYFFAWKFRETNRDKSIEPSAEHSKFFTLGLWAIPSVCVLVLAAVMWPSTHMLDPKRAIHTDKKPITIQVIAQRWKWLFIYPEQEIATVNFLQVPVDTPIVFELTADEAPMSSFWIPHWGGQLYAMTGHNNTLNLMATKLGDFPGSTAEINGRGFAGMKFTARSSTQDAFDQWIRDVKKSPQILSDNTYRDLLSPSENNPAVLFASYDTGLYDRVLLKYTGHAFGHSHADSKEAGH